MGNVLFSRATQSPEQQLLLLALEGNIGAFFELVAAKNVYPSKIEIFDAIVHDYGLPEKHYLLFELAKRGHTLLFKTLVAEHGFCISIFEDEKKRKLEEYQKGKEQTEKLGLPIIYDASSEYHATRSVYYFPLPRFVDDRISECREKLRELMGQWLRVNAEYQKLDVIEHLPLDEEALTAYQKLHAEWAGSVWRMSFGFSATRREEEARKHKRSRPRVNPFFEKVMRRRALRTGMDEHKKTHAELAALYRNLHDIRQFIKSEQAKQPA